MTGMLVALVSPGHGSQPIINTLEQVCNKVYRGMLTFS
jgi:hypothetical protein